MWSDLMCNQQPKGTGQLVWSSCHAIFKPQFVRTDQNSPLSITSNRVELFIFKKFEFKSLRITISVDDAEVLLWNSLGGGGKYEK